MDKKTIIIIVVAILAVILIAGAGYFWWFKKSKNIFENIGDAAQKITDQAIKGVLPSIETNPLGNKPDINPAASANPIKNIKVNPFE